MKSWRLIAIVEIISLCSWPAEAGIDEFRQLAEQCAEIRESSDDSFQGRALTRPLSDKLEKLAQEANTSGLLGGLMAEHLEEAGQCVSYSRQIPAGVAFDSVENRFVSLWTIRAREEAERRIGAEERAALAQAEASALERLRQERQQSLENEINNRVFESCSELAVEEPIAAYTNPICVQSFKTNGLPNQ